MNLDARFRDLHLGQGAEMALPIWGEYMQKVYADPLIDVSTRDFPFPEGGVSVLLDCNQNNLINNDEEF